MGVQTYSVRRGSSVKLRPLGTIILGVSMMWWMKSCTALSLAFAVSVSAVHAAPAYKTETVVQGSPMHGVHGLAFGPDGALYAASLTGHSIYRVDIKSGEVTTFVGTPRGTADDLAFGPDGTMAWTAGGFAAIFARTPQGRIVTLAGEMPGVNSVNFTKDGRVFFTRIFGGDGLYEADPNGEKPPRVVAEKIGGLNGFEIKDGFIYGPLFFKGKIVKIDIETGAMTDFATGFMQPAAVNLDSKGRVVALDYVTGELVRFSPDGKTRQILATLPPPADNLAIAPDDFIYVSSSAYNGITEVNPETGATRRITWGNIAAPGTAAVIEKDGRDHIVLADSWGPRVFDPATGAVAPIPRGPGVAGATGLAVAGDHYILSNFWPFGTVQIIERATGKLVSSLPGFAAPYEIEPVDDGFVVADFGGDRLIHVANDDAHTRKQAAWGLEGPVGLANAGNGVFYVSEYGKKDKKGTYSNGDLSRVDTKTNERTIIARGLKRPEGLALGPDGRLIVAEVGAKRVVAIDPKGKKPLDVLAENLNVGLDVGNHVPAPFLPTGLTVTKDGAIYVSGDVENVLYRIIRK
jgi:sugar lactone lactonase YvrE